MKPPAIAAAPPQDAGALEHQDVGPGAGGLHRRGGPGDAVAGDDDIGLVVPGGDRRGGDRRDVVCSDVMAAWRRAGRPPMRGPSSCRR